MKKIGKQIWGVAAIAVGSLAMTGCVEETFPTSMATDEIVANSPAAAEGLTNGMPAYVVDVWNTDSHCYFGYPAEMIVRDMLTGDYTHVGEVGYSHFISWARNKYMGGDYMKQQFHWNYYYGFLGTVNTVIRGIDEESASPEQLGSLGTAYAYRAMLYLDLARMFEFLPNDVFSDGKNSEGVDVMYLTVPIVKDNTTEEEAANNPRVPHQEMYDFILGDLDKAEQLVANLKSNGGGAMPDLACVYGLKARLYMWQASWLDEKGESADAVAEYTKAKDAARQAIDKTSSKPLTEADALSTANGYNKAEQFMWAALQNDETYAVQTGIINWTSWVSNQTTFGYTGASTELYVSIDKKMYERISDYDWRKKQWVAPKGSKLARDNQYISEDDKKFIPAYGSLKFRPGNGNREEYTVGAATALPLMRVEEMYFIEAEAAEHVSAGTGIDLLKKFMTENRNPRYRFNGDDAIEEIVFQKRVELWGEGQSFFDIKRLNMSVTRGYTDTNWSDEQCRLNTNGRPAWMNYVIVKTEQESNVALINYNNPDPTDVYAQWK